MFYFFLFQLYPPVSRTVISALNCDDFGPDGSYLHPDYTIDCGSTAYTPVKVVGIGFIVLWPVGAVAFFLGFFVC